eukprot:tig00000388_g24820.t1
MAHSSAVAGCLRRSISLIGSGSGAPPAAHRRSRSTSSSKDAAVPCSPPRAKLPPPPSSSASETRGPRPSAGAGLPRIFYFSCVSFLAVLLYAFEWRSGSSLEGSASEDIGASLREASSFWGPTSANIDWCERNYVISKYFIAEFWNTLSNFGFCIIGLLSFALAYREGFEPRFLLAHLLMVTIGVGSGLFHMTLQFRYQMLDELPMFYVVVLYLYLLERPAAHAARRRAAAGLAVYAVAWTVAAIWLTGRHPIAFQLHFVGMAALIVLRVHSRLPAWDDAAGRAVLHRAIGSGLAGVACWACDRLCCERIHATLPVNPQLHACWHLLMALHLVHLNAFLVLELARADGTLVSIAHALPAFPYVRIAPAARAPSPC